MDIKVSAIVVTYNRRELLLESINALLQQTYKVMEINIIDNASTDSTYEYLCQNNIVDNPIVKYYNTNENLGGAGGFNFGIKKAYIGKGDLFWIMDDDTIPSITALEELIKVYHQVDNNKLGFLCSNVKWTDGNACNMNIPHKTDRWIDTIDQGFLEVIKCTFVSVLIKRNVVREVGLPIKDFFIWGDDTEYTRRITLSGYKSYFAYNSIVVHKMISNTAPNIVTDSIDRVDRHLYRYRNTIYVRIKKKYFGKVEAKRAKKKIKRDFMRVLFKSSNRNKRLYILIKGVIWGCFFNPPIEYITKNNTE